MGLHFSALHSFLPQNTQLCAWAIKVPSAPASDLGSAVKVKQEVHFEACWVCVSTRLQQMEPVASGLPDRPALGLSQGGEGWAACYCPSFPRSSLPSPQKFLPLPPCWGISFLREDKMISLWFWNSKTRINLPELTWLPNTGRNSSFAGAIASAPASFS